MKYVFCILLLVGCSHRDVIDFPDGSFSFPDSSVEYRDPNPCMEETLDRDFANCGVCDNHCNGYAADTCRDGMCWCGAHAPCTGPNRCLMGRCVAPAPGDSCIADADCPRNGSCVEGRCTDACEFDDVCPAGYACVAAQCTFLECVPEVCDGIDNDCDGVVDGTGASPLAQFCVGDEVIEGFPMSIMLPCQAGVRACVEGEWTECIGDIPPVEEQGLLACDLIDNDCDGCVDGTVHPDDPSLCITEPPTGFDVVYVLDVSGSMAGTITAVKSATDMHAAALASPFFRFGLVLVGTTDAPFYHVEQDLTDFATFQTVLTATDPAAGGEEPQWNAVEELGNGMLPVSWRTGSLRIIIVFTDEEGQNARTTSEAQMCAALTHGEALATVTTPTHALDFDDCGLTFSLTNDAVEMAAQLNTIIAEPCR